MNKNICISVGEDCILTRFDIQYFMDPQDKDVIKDNNIIYEHLDTIDSIEDILTFDDKETAEKVAEFLKENTNDSLYTFEVVNISFEAKVEKVIKKKVIEIEEEVTTTAPHISNIEKGEK